MNDEQEDRYRDRRREELECDEEFRGELFTEVADDLAGLLFGSFKDGALVRLVNGMQQLTTDRVNAKIAMEMERSDWPVPEAK